ncbi:MAG: MMPL family transporter [Desulfurococcales archaeon]|nr:MMPL family transporter [Desulfurococcales archaeon]
MNKYPLLVAVWLTVLIALLPWALKLPSLLSYDEQIFMPRDAESVVGLEILRENGIEARDVLIVIVKPNDYETVKNVEESLATLPGVASITGPATAYDSIIARIESIVANMTYILESANSTYTKLLDKLDEALNTLREVETILNGTYGTAELFLRIASLYSAIGAEDPYYMAYRDLRNLTPEELSWFVDGFYNNFRLLVYNGYDPVVAADRAVKMASLANPLVWVVVKDFTIEDYRDRDKVIEFIYRVGRLEESSISLDDLKTLLYEGKEGVVSIIKERMSSKGVPQCIVDGFDLVAHGTSPREAVEVSCLDIASPRPYPEGIPDELRRLLVNGGYAAIYAYLDSESYSDPESLVGNVTSMLDGVVEEYYLYGSIVLESDLRSSLSSDVSRIDKATSILVIAILLLLLRGLGAPLVILLTTGIALVTALGSLGLIAWMGFDIYYISRLLIIPLIFGVTVDYSIFYLYRIAEEYGDSGWPRALDVARRRAGRALILGGVSVIIGFTAYLVSPSGALRSIGAAFVVAAIVAFLSSLTLLPGIIGTLGVRRVFWPLGKPPGVHGSHSLFLKRLAESSIKSWIKVLIVVLTILATAASAAVIVDVGITSDIRMSLGEEGLYVAGEAVYSKHFDISAVSKLYVIGELEGYDPKELDAVIEGVLGVDGVVYVSRVNASSSYIILEAGLDVAPLSDEALRVVRDVRSVLASMGFEEWIVTGLPAMRNDLVDHVNNSFYKVTLPVALLGILVYLSIGMGSIPMPLRLLATIIASSIASLALTSITFSILYGVELYWIVPLIVLGLMITLGLDYDIFLATRLREEMSRGRGQDESLIIAVERSGLVITACGLILAGAFGSLLLSGSMLLKQTGMAVASSILIDTFIIRPIVAPAVISLAGSRNWWPGRGLFREWD